MDLATNETSLKNKPYKLARKVEEPQGGNMTERDLPKQKPSIEQVLAYAKQQVKIQIFKAASHLPKEQHEEIEQEAYVRVWASYAQLDPALGWKSFIQKHCFGAVQDYLKGGLNTTENEVGMKRAEIISDEDNEPLSVDETAGFFGVFEELHKSNKLMTPNWDLLSRLAGKDDDLHIVCKVLLGYSQEAIAEQYGCGVKENELSRERISQRVREFMTALDDPMNLFNPKIEQYIFALGLSDFFHMSATDTGYGWDFKEFDLNREDSFKQVREYYTPTLFDLEGFN